MLVFSRLNRKYISQLFLALIPQFIGSYAGLSFMMLSFGRPDLVLVQNDYIEYSMIVPYAFSVSILYAVTETHTRLRFVFFLILFLSLLFFSDYFVGKNALRTALFLVSLQFSKISLYRGDKKLVFGQFLVLILMLSETMVYGNILPYSSSIFILFEIFVIFFTKNKIAKSSVKRDFPLIIGNICVTWGFGYYMLVDKLILSDSFLLKYLVLISMISAVTINTYFLRAENLKADFSKQLLGLLIVNVLLIFLHKHQFISLLILSFGYLFLQSSEYFLIKNALLFRGITWLVIGVFMFFYPTLEAKWVMYNCYVLFSYLIIRNYESFHSRVER